MAKKIVTRHRHFLNLICDMTASKRDFTVYLYIMLKFLSSGLVPNCISRIDKIKKNKKSILYANSLPDTN